MRFFDCYAVFGRGSTPPPRYAATPDELIDEMEFHGVSDALVTCAAQRDDSPLVGNPLVVKLTAGNPRLRPAWVILPPQTEELAPSVDAFVDSMRANGIRALWAFPSRHRFALNRTTLGPLCEELTARRVPLFVPITELVPAPGWQALDSFLADFPQLTLVVTDMSVWGQDRYFRPLVERYPRFHLEISRYELGRGLEAFRGKYGPERLLFATRYPETPMGGPVLNLLHADIPAHEKEAIASGNLERLLGEARL